MYKMARRIQGRAVKRCGELLKEYQSKGGRPPSKNGKGKTTGRSQPTSSQKQAAKSAGMSKDQEKKARRVAEIPGRKPTSSPDVRIAHSAVFT